MDEGSSEETYTVLQTSDALDASVFFHVVNDAIGFILYMYQQIPCNLPDMIHDFEAMRTEYEELETDLANIELKPPARRKLTSQKRAVKHEIGKLEKLMNKVSNLQKALQLVVTEHPGVQRVMLILGGSPVRPQYVFELYFSHGENFRGDEGDFAKSRVAEWLSRKAIRTLISKGVGSGSYPGQMKLFLMVTAPSSFNLPLHFLPKRDLRLSKKIMPLKLRFNCKTQASRTHDLDLIQNGDPTDTTESLKSNLMWFQCRHVIKGLASQLETEE